MERRKGTTERNRNVFKGSVLISLLVETNSRFFPSRTVACQFARRLFLDGHIRSISASKDFEDSAQLYVWCDLEYVEEKHGRTLMTAAASNSNTYTSDKKPTKDINWQLIQDIRNTLLNRSEAYNIVTSYNTFIQELGQDACFQRNPGFNKNAPLEGNDTWGQKNTPFTSTLEIKKGTVQSRDSSFDNQNYPGKLRDNKIRRKNSKRTSGRRSKGNLVTVNSSSVLNKDHPHLNPPHKGDKQLQQEHNFQHHNTPTSHNIPNVNTESDRMNMEHNLASSERLVSTSQNSKLPQLPSSDSANMDSNDGSLQQVAVTSSKKSKPDNENISVRHSEPSLNRENDVSRRLTEQFNNQPQVYPLDTQNWLEPGIPQFSMNQQWLPKKIRPEEGSGQVNDGRSRWADGSVHDGMENGRRWPESTYSYSDNEKQLLEEMRRMKKEHQNVLRTYESRINKLMAKMHELRNIAEMLEHSSNKSSPYGILPGKLALLNILGGKAVNGKNIGADSTNSETDQVPPPLPPRPGKGSRVYPNKPIIRTNVTMKPLPWSRIILESSAAGAKQAHTVWHSMTEPKIDTDELQRLFSESSDFLETNLYDDICQRRGRSQVQLVSVYDSERSQRIISELRSLHCTLSEITQAFMTLNCEGLHTDSFAELLELLTSPRELDQISYHVKKRGTAQLDAPEYLVSELAKIDHFRERLEFLRFKNKIQINLFEIDQQLRELQTACEEITTNVALRHVLETILAIGNHMNAGTDKGQADGFKVNILTSLRDMQDTSKQCSLLELAMKTYCLMFESDLGFGCPTRFRLPEPSNMRHAAQVSFEDIQRALKELKDELSIVRNKLETLSKREGNSLTVTLRAISENFLTSAVEVLAEEQKLLDDTRVQFWKTASFFSYDGQKSTPHEFFQIWASFLHDCKYYWKLAHRNLAKAKFNTDLTAKSQLSCSSLPGFTSLRSAIMKHVVTFQQDDEVRTSKSQQLQHINSWIQSVGRYTMEMQAEDAGSIIDIPDYNGYHPDISQGNDKKRLHLHHQESEQSSSSPPYQNENLAEPRSSKAIANLGRQLEPENRTVKDARVMQINKTTHDDHEPPQGPSSPKPINATPPNVIKPQPTIHPNFRLPTNTSAVPDFAKSVVTCEANSTSMKNHHKHSSSYPDDNFGFEPVYESLSHYSQNQFDLDVNEDASNPQDGARDVVSSGNISSLDPESIQKKNSNFFKSFLKRELVRVPLNDERLQASPHRNVSTPFSKVKHTFAQKFSGSGNAKNSNSGSAKNYSISSQNVGMDTSSKPLPGTPSKHEPYHIIGKPASLIVSGDVKRRDDVDYQNMCFPDQQRQENLNQIDTPDSLEVHPDCSERIFYREGHESLHSTVSSLQSVRGRNRLFYQGNGLYTRDVPTGRHVLHGGSKDEAGDSENSSSKIRIYNNKTEPANQSPMARIRAPIALGSNMSISEAYTKGAEHDPAQSSGSYESQQHQSAFRDVNQENSSLLNHDRKMSDPKWIKSSPVPVYKARLIPNYENQSKYDPRFEGGIRGQATGNAASIHIPQVSISSDVYRQELQKKSEQYVGGGIYPSPGLTPGGSGSLRGSGSVGSSYTILPPKPNHYQAAPVVLSQNTPMTNSAPENISQMYSLSSNNVPETSQGKNFNHTLGFKNNPENGEAVSSLDYSPKGIRHNTENLHFERKLEVAKGQSLPVRADKGKTVVVNKYPTYRSVSAHSILGRNDDSRKEDRELHFSNDRSENQQLKTESHISRRDIGGKKTTATSQRDQSHIRNDGPPSVISLIDKFEKATDLNNPGIGLLDISDKPPSMTSTPVVKRRNQGVTTSQQSHGKLAASKSDSESQRTHSEGNRKMPSQKEIANMPGWPIGTSIHVQSGNVHVASDRHISNSYHQIVATHNCKQVCQGDNSKTVHSQLQSDVTQHFSHNSKSLTNDQAFQHKSQQQQQSQNAVPDTSTNHYHRDHCLEPASASDQLQPSAHMSPGYDNITQWHHQRQTPQTNHVTPYQPQLSSVPPYNSFPPNGNVNLSAPESFRCNDDIFSSSKPINSAFEPPVRVAAKYGRQPGAMAVVKPTVMNI